MNGTSPSPPSLRNNDLSHFTQAALADLEKNLTWPETERVDEHVEQDSDSSQLPKETLEMGDNTSPPVPATQRKLPIPNASANSNSSLKGMLIRPKRILPAQPDNSKAKRAQQESSSQIKPHTSEDLRSPSEVVNAVESVKSCAETAQKQTILPKLQIDVDRLKTYFLTHGNEGSEVKKLSVNGKDVGLNKSGSGQSPGGSLPHTYLTRESTLYNFNPDGLSKVREWCSPGEINRVASKMSSSDNTIGKDRNIRSPSPKSNTTWDRSSSGYSSDERADPRSPPPRDTASVVSKIESAEDDVSGTADKSEKGEDATKVVTTTVEQVITSQDAGDYNESDNDTCGGDDVGSDDANDDMETTLDKDSSNVCSCTVSDGANNSFDKTDQNQNNVVSKDEMVSLGPISGVDNSPGTKPNGRRPIWQAGGSPASGRIQYRKSTSESVISLRHPSRQGVSADNFDGLTVCGKSYPQVSNATPKTDSFVTESGKNDVSSRVDSITHTSAFTPIEKSPLNPETLAESVPKIDINKQDSVFKTRPVRQQFAPPRSPRVIKNLSLSLAGTLAVGRDEKDIRKTLHDLSSPRRSSPGGQMVPIRARHTINSTSGNTNQPMKVTEATTGQPMGLAFTAFQGVNTMSDNKKGVQFFGKKMWRAPQGQPENAQMRPFSPFGGTLPPSKIKENAQKRHDPETET